MSGCPDFDFVFLCFFFLPFAPPVTSIASATTAAPAGVAAVEERVDQADFQAAASFEGPREGFVYRTGAWGSGYYLDLPPVPPSDRVHGTDKQTTEQTAANLAAVEEELFTKKAVVSTEGSASGSVKRLMPPHSGTKTLHTHYRWSRI
jgi:hypothetical protein